MFNRRRKFFLICTFLVIVISEAIATIGLRLVYPEISREGLKERQRSLALTSREGTDRPHAIHPFLGWVHDPDVSDGEKAFGLSVPANGLGFADTRTVVQKRRSGRLLIAITGGSVAWQMSAVCEDDFRRVFKESVSFGDHEVIVLRLGMSGYKQPQQLMSLCWLQSLGAEFDAVINVDGFNEVALTALENLPQHVHYSYPRGWEAETLNFVDRRFSSLSFELLSLRAGRQTAALNSLNSPFGWTSLRNLIWAVHDASYRNRIVALEKTQARREQVPDGRGFARTGPREPNVNAENVLSKSAALWMKSSVQLHHLLAGNGTVYLHVLQPNLHVPDSKLYSASEHEMLSDPALAEWDAPEAVRKGYPMLLGYVPELRASGVQFLDLTQLFKNEESTMYSDSCCHLSMAGNTEMSTAIALRLRDLLEQAHAKKQQP